MSNIYFLGREDAEGLARVQNRGHLIFDEEVGGWDTMCSNNETYCWEFATTRIPKHEPALHVFDSHTENREISKYERPEETPWPTITYQTRFTNEQ